MDLALALGRTLDELNNALTEREIGLWFRYAAQKGLPQRRTELYLAQVAMHLRGGVLSDFLFDAAAQPPALKAEEGASALGAIAGGVGVRVLGKKRKKEK